MARVLVVDDEEKLVRVVVRALATRGVPAEGTTEASRGLKMALTGTFQLIILDLLMPSNDGRWVLEQTMARRPSQRVLVLSGLSDLETKLLCFRLGASDYLPKPFAVQELLARVGAQLRSNGTPNSDAPVAAAGITLDIHNRVADVGEGPVNVTEREFLLLRHLLDRAGEVCSRQEILSDVWGFAFDPGTNVVDVYVRRLRSKLGPYAIKTVRNVGYCVPAEAVFTRSISGVSRPAALG
jgi:two-component system OmpR family response regulator